MICTIRIGKELSFPVSEAFSRRSAEESITAYFKLFGGVAQLVRAAES